MKYWMIIWVFGVVWAACSRKTFTEELAIAQEDEVMLTVSNLMDFDTSLLLFFRMTSDTQDTFAYMTKVYHLTEVNNRVKVKVPVGYYRVILIANGQEQFLKTRGMASSENMYLDYSDGTQPSVMYYGRTYIKSGEGSMGMSGLLPLVCQLDLTIKDIPQFLSRLEVVLHNTGSGVNLNFNFEKAKAEPPVRSILYNVQPGTSPQVHLIALPMVDSSAQTWLEVNCYSQSGALVYTGASPSFSWGGTEYITVACTFEELNAINTERRDLRPDELFILKRAGKI